MKNENKLYITAQEVSENLDISISASYRLIRDLNKSLKEKGFITISGKTSRAFFFEKWYCPKASESN